MEAIPEIRCTPRQSDHVSRSCRARWHGQLVRGTASAMVPTEDAQTTIVESVGSGQARYQGFRAVGHLALALARLQQG